MQKLGIVLSGGGVKGVAHIGFLQALREHGIQPDYIAGSSAGALVGAMYSKGYNAKEMMQFFKKTPLISLFNISAFKPGLMDTVKYRPYFEEYFPEDSFEALNNKLFITTSDLYKGQSAIHSQGALIAPLMASCSVPLVFSPIEIEGAFHADGGIMNNFPVEPLLDLDLDYIVGSYVCSAQPTDKKQLNNSLKVMYRAFELSTEALCRHKFDLCDFVFAPQELAEVGYLDAKGVEKAYEIGYEMAVKNLDSLLSKLLDIAPSLPDAIAPNLLQAPKIEKEDAPKSGNTFSYLDIWPLNWAFGKGNDKKPSA